ncbi:MAG: hypothetical protein H6832_15280 [Planctomycetes bacterium]|nr:hypothetical protein [Planctomycetota bacterium]MCB9892673.1 hypothetical protein [Planctomycetota bacterium]MCB9919763.1 hypothetical protein [Planctomycetota bacterium]
MSLIPRILAMLFISAASVTGQEAGIRFYGTPCNDTVNPVPVLFRYEGSPKLGASVAIINTGHYTNRVISQTAYITLGFSDKRIAAFALPFDLSLIPLTPRSCGSLLTSTDLIAFGGARFVFTVPNDARLLGARFYQQILELRCNLQRRECYWAASMGAEVTIGT